MYSVCLAVLFRKLRTVKYFPGCDEEDPRVLLYDKIAVTGFNKLHSQRYIIRNLSILYAFDWVLLKTQELTTRMLNPRYICFLIGL